MGEGDGAADGAGDAVEGECDVRGAEGFRGGGGERAGAGGGGFAGGQGLCLDFLVEAAGYVDAHVDEFVEDGAIVCHVLRGMAGSGIGCWLRLGGPGLAGLGHEQN